VLAFRTTGAEMPFVEWLQQAARSLGQRAILVSQVQDLALWVTRSRRQGEPTPFPGLRERLERLSSAASGSWVVTVPLEERRVDAGHSYDLSDQLNSVDAEWRVLEYLVLRGGIPKAASRDAGAFDWVVDLDGVATNIEVKQKAALGYGSHWFQWALAGASRLAANQWMSAFRWHVDLPIDALASTVRCSADTVFESDGRVSGEVRDQLAALPSVGYDDEVPARSETLEFGRGWRGGGPALTVAPRNPSVPVLTIDRNSDERVQWISGESEGGWRLEELGAREADGLRELLKRLRIKEQHQRRATSGVYVVVWWTPWLWESSYTRSWMESVVDSASAQLGVPMLAVWPNGFVETANEPWVATPEVRTRFPRLVAFGP
jgi:hypothetical protein